MKSVEIARSLIEQSPVWSQNKLASKLGLSPQAMSNRMQAVDLKASFLAEIVESLGYELVVVPQESKLPKGSIRVSNE